MVEKNRVNGLAHRVVASEAEGHIGHAARDLGARQVLLDPAGGFNEVHRIVVVLFNAGGNGKNIGVKNDVFRREAHFIHQDAVSALTDFNFALKGVGLALLVKGHDHCGGAIAAKQARLALELGHAFLH